MTGSWSNSRDSELINPRTSAYGVAVSAAVAFALMVNSTALIGLTPKFVVCAPVAVALVRSGYHLKAGGMIHSPCMSWVLLPSLSLLLEVLETYTESFGVVVIVGCCIVGLCFVWEVIYVVLEWRGVGCPFRTCTGYSGIDSWTT